MSCIQGTSTSTSTSNAKLKCSGADLSPLCIVHWAAGSLLRLGRSCSSKRSGLAVDLLERIVTLHWQRQAWIFGEERGNPKRWQGRGSIEMHQIRDAVSSREEEKSLSAAGALGCWSAIEWQPEAKKRELPPVLRLPSL